MLSSHACSRLFQGPRALHSAAGHPAPAGRSGAHRSRTAHSHCERQNSPGLSCTGLPNCAFSTHTKLLRGAARQEGKGREGWDGVLTIRERCQAGVGRLHPRSSQPACAASCRRTARRALLSHARTGSSRAWRSRGSTPPAGDTRGRDRSARSHSCRRRCRCRGAVHAVRVPNSLPLTTSSQRLEVMATWRRGGVGKGAARGAPVRLCRRQERRAAACRACAAARPCTARSTRSARPWPATHRGPGAHVQLHIVLGLEVHAAGPGRQ